MANESEKITRKKRIDPKLKAADWSVVPNDTQKSLADVDGCAVEEYPTSNGPVDYALCDAGRVVGAVEAKKLTVGPDGVLTQAARYSRGLDGNGFDLPEGHNVPFLYSTNGELIRFHARILDHITSGSVAMTRFRNAILASAYAEALAFSGEQAPSLGELLREPLKNGFSARPVARETPFRVLTLTATTSGWFNPEHFKYTDRVSSPFWLEPGDILVQRGNTAEYVDVPALYDGEPRQFIYPDLMIRVRAQKDIDPRYLWFILLAPQSRNYLRTRATGSAGNMPKINQKILSGIPIPLADNERREVLVSRIEKAFALSDALDAKIAVARQEAKRLQDSILAKAFGGELTLEPEKAS